MYPVYIVLSENAGSVQITMEVVLRGLILVIMDCYHITATQFYILLAVHLGLYSVRINYRRISLRHNLCMKCRKIVNFVSITHSER
jgi:hypothetical protein